VREALPAAFLAHPHPMPEPVNIPTETQRGNETVFCTVATKPYLPAARVLARSIHRHHPNALFLVLLADRVDGYFDPATEPFSMITLDDLDDAEAIGRMTFYYSPFELSCALKAYLHDYLNARGLADRWLYLDADTYVCHPLDAMFSALSTVSMLLTPHRTVPSPPVQSPSELLWLGGGNFNGGVLGVRRTETSARFIAWFKQRLTLWSLHHRRSLFVEQLWLNLVPLYFPDVYIDPDPAANLGLWNLDACTLSIAPDGEFLVDSRPLLIAHFSGWEIDRPHEVSRYAPHFRGIRFPAWEALAERYRAELLENGYAEVKNWPYAFDRFTDGSPITPAMRQMYHDDVATGETAARSPFEEALGFRQRIRKTKNHRLIGRIRRKIGWVSA
jgi:hypothetical protein